MAPIDPTTQPGMIAGQTQPDIPTAPMTFQNPQDFGNALAGLSGDKILSPTKPAAPAEPTPAQKIATGALAGVTATNGRPGDWARGILAGTLSALAGFGAAGRVPEGAGALYGIGAAARQAQNQKQRAAQIKQDNSFKQQQLGLEQQRFNYEKKMGDAEAATRQARLVMDQQEHSIRMRTMTDENNRANQAAARDEAQFRNQQAIEMRDLQNSGGIPLTVNGQPVPEFDSIKDLNDYAMQHKDQIIGNYDAVPVYDQKSGKYSAWETPRQVQTWKVDVGN